MGKYKLVPGGTIRLPAGARVVAIRQSPVGVVLQLRWAWWRPRWTRPTRWL